jgi:signal transduction histidine kinase
MTGYAPEEMLGHSIQEFIDPAQWPMVVNILAEGGITQFDMRVIHKNGSLVDVEVLGHPFTYLGEKVRVVAVRDMTERKKAEKHAFDLAVEKERVQLLSNFVTQTSHEFRTPLTNIELRASLLDRVADPEKRRQYVREIRDQVAGMNELLNASLLMARLDSGMDMDFAPVDVVVLFRLVCANLEESAEKNEIRLIIDEGISLPPIRANRSMLQAALTHLIENALRYTPPGGTVQIGGHRDGDQIVIEVRDTGIGMTHEQARRIFERFYRVDEAHSTRGFGLGLPIVKKIVEVHSGRIEVQSEPDQGSVFRVLLPTR